MPLTDAERAELRRRLSARAAALRGEIGDDVKENLNAEPEMAALQRDVDELREVEEALAGLEQPDFGRCADCGATIEYSRLLAQPSASRCLGCQDKHEHAARGGS